MVWWGDLNWWSGLAVVVSSDGLVWWSVVVLGYVVV